MNAPVRIIGFELRHMAAILAIERASFGAGAYGEALFRRLRIRCGGLFYVAAVRRRIRGYIAATLTGHTAEIISIAVHPEWRRAGVGQALFAHILANLRARGAGDVQLAVRVDNVGAVRLYRRFGFRRVGTVEEYYEDGGDAWIMRAILRTGTGGHGRDR